MLSFCLEGESGLSGEGSDQQEDAGSQPSHIEDAQLQIYTLMHRDSYPRFLNSLSSDHWCRGVTLLVWVIDPRLPPLSFSHSHHPISPHSLHFSPLLNHSRRKYSFILYSCRHGWIKFFFFAYSIFPCHFWGNPSFFSVSPEHAQTETGRHRVENAVFESYFSPLTIIPSVCGSSSINYWFSQPSFFFFTQTCFATFISWRL